MRVNWGRFIKRITQVASSTYTGYPSRTLKCDGKHGYGFKNNVDGQSYIDRA